MAVVISLIQVLEEVKGCGSCRIDLPGHMSCEGAERERDIRAGGIGYPKQLTNELLVHFGVFR